MSSGGEASKSAIPSMKAEMATEDSNGERGTSSSSLIGGGGTGTGTGIDLISTIESDLTLLIQIMSSSIHYISNKSAHVQLNADIPLFNPVGAGQMMASKMLVDETSMMESIEELTDDLVGKVKDIEKLVEQLPQEREEGIVKTEISELHQKIAGVNKEYKSALQEASALKDELDTALHTLCKDYQATREKMATSAASQSASDNSRQT